jgi:hypothetical protein
MEEIMKKLNVITLASVLFSSAAMASGLSVLNCKGTYEEVKKNKAPTEVSVEVNVVTGDPLFGGLAEVIRSSDKAKYQPVGYYIRFVNDAAPNGLGYTVYESKNGFKLSIPEVQLSDLLSSQRRGTIELPRVTSAIPVLCEDK